MEKIDLRKKFKQLYTANEKPEIIEVPELTYLSYTGRGEPGGPAYMESIGALYTTVYTIKFALKKRGKDFTVMTLEGLWWWDNPSAIWLKDAPPRDTWNWESLMMVPDIVTEDVLEEQRPALIEKKGKAIEKIKLVKLHEGTSAQILHVGPYSDEPRTMKVLHGFLEEQGYKLRGHHHEIYMSDPRRVSQERWKTIIRYPVEK